MGGKVDGQTRTILVDVLVLERLLLLRHGPDDGREEVVVPRAGRVPARVLRGRAQVVVAVVAPARGVSAALRDCCVRVPPSTLEKKNVGIPQLLTMSPTPEGAGSVRVLR